MLANSGIRPKDRIATKDRTVVDGITELVAP